MAPAATIGPEGLSPWARTWVERALGAPTAIQSEAWPVLASKRDAVLVAPTGSGKTLAAFLASLDSLAHTPPEERGRVLYISPLKALASDIERNLRSPLVGLEQVAAEAGVEIPTITVGIRTGDTPQAERTRQAKHPPDVWITTPESLFLLLTSQARSALAGVRTVIIDEVHALADTKRGAHLALSLERLDELLTAPAQRIALSATVSPVSEVIRYVNSTDPDSVVVVRPSIDKQIALTVESPVDDFRDIGSTARDEYGNEIVTGSSAGDAERTSVWPAIAERVVDIIDQHRSTIVFVNSRRLAERLTSRINDVAEAREMDAPLAQAHHGSVSKEVRRGIEDDLKSGRLRAVVATSSMELGIDMGAVDVVVQIQSPVSVASGLQRVGRAGHSVGQVSTGHIISTHAHDLLVATTIAERMDDRAIEEIRLPSLPLDVLAQQIVAMCAMDEWTVDALLAVVRRAASFSNLSESLLVSVLNMLSGTYPSDRFAELRPRIVWDRASGILRGRPGAARLAVTNAGTIPDRGLFGVHIATEGFPRVGELDEEMVYESRVGEVITLGASTWRIMEITHDRVLVSPAPGALGRMPFWHGDALGRPAHLAGAIGDAARRRHSGIPALDSYLLEQQTSTGVIPDDVNLLLEAFRDEIGDWRVVLHSPYGARVHAPWALAASRILSDRLGIDAQVMHADDGIVVRLPDYIPVTDSQSPLAASDSDHVLAEVLDALTIDPADIESLIHADITGSALFASRFRECAGRSLLLPRRRPDRRTPLWQQRQRAGQLLQVASDYPDFPIVLETMRECLQDVYDVPALIHLLETIDSGAVRISTTVTDHPSPFARSLLFGYVATFLYEGDAPLAERRAQALSIDTELLADLLGTAELRSLLDIDAICEVEDEIGHRSTNTRARNVEDAADLLRVLGPIDPDNASEIGVDTAWLDELVTSGRAITVTVAGHRRIAAIEDAARLRDALGVVLPPGIPDAHLEPVDDPLADVVTRFARTHGPFTIDELTDEIGVSPAALGPVIDRLVTTRRLLRGEFRPGGRGAEIIDADVLRKVRRRSVARLREEIEPVEMAHYAAFLPAWQGVLTSKDEFESETRADLVEVMDRLSALSVPVSCVMPILRARVADVQPAQVDALLTRGLLTWWSMGPLGARDARIAWAPTAVAAGMRELLRGSHPRLVDNTDEDTRAMEPVSRAIVDVLSGGGAFYADAVHAALISTGPTVSIDTVDAALWDLARHGWVTCDSFSYLLARVGSKASSRSHTRSNTARGPRSGHSRHRTPARSRLPRRTRLSSEGGGGATGPRWSLAPGVASPADSSAGLGGDRAAQQRYAAEYSGLLLERWAVVTRMAVAAEDPVGGFSDQYRVLSAMADAGACQRIYAIEGAGGAQFALEGAVDTIRDHREFGDHQEARAGQMLVLSAVDPANPYGTLLSWPGPDEPAETTGRTSARPSRRAGSFVVLHGSELLAWLDPSGGSLTTRGITDEATASDLLRSLARARVSLNDNHRGILTTVNGMSLLDNAATALWRAAAQSAGLAAVPRGWKWVARA